MPFNANYGLILEWLNAQDRKTGAATLQAQRIASTLVACNSAADVAGAMNSATSDIQQEMGGEEGR